MSLTPQWLDELRSRVSLSGLISRTTRLTKAGHEFKACCPFHNEKSPSFTVNDVKGFYHCFGCGAHGDAIRWMTDQRGLSFMDAVKELADVEKAELAVIDEFLPQQMSDAETSAAIEAIKAELGASSVKDMGKVMAELKARHGSELDMSKASGLVKAALT